MYSSVTDILKANDQRTIAQWSDDAAGAQVNADVVNDCIVKADAVIDSRCSVRYTVPFSPVPQVVRDCSVTIATYYLATRRPGLDAPKDVKEKYDSAVAWLKEAASGKANVIGAITPTPAQQASGMYQGDDREFTRKTMKGF